MAARRFLAALALAAAILALSAGGGGTVRAQPGSEALALTPVQVQLKWFHQFQFAGYYAAIEQGYYREAGLDVSLLEGSGEIDPVEVVLSGAADFGVGSSELVIHRSRGKPVVALAVILQHSPFVLVARYGDDLQSVHDLIGRRVMVESHAAELEVYLTLERAPLNRMTVLPHSGNPLDLGPVADAMTAYTSTEPFILQKHDIPFQVFSPRSSGIDFYGDTLFTSERMVRDNRDLVAAFREASLRGWRYAMDNRDELIELILERYPDRLSRAALTFEAEELRRLAIPDMVDVGYMYPGRWRHIADGFASIGLMPSDFPLDGFLFDLDAETDLRWLYLTLAGAIGFGLVGGAISARFHRLNRRLKQEIEGNAALNAELLRLATTDSLTGVANRRHFLEEASREMARAARSGLWPALLMVDIDRFKQVNDRYGHPTGDRAIVSLVEACMQILRDIDLFGRVGGEEFAVLLPGTGATEARLVAERLRSVAARVAVMSDDGEAVPITVSIGIATAVPNESLSRLVARADRGLYMAKQQGRNRVCEAVPAVA